MGVYGSQTFVLTEWTCRYIRTYLGTIYHPMGTAAMLPREIGGALN